MYQIIKQSYDDRIKMYSECTKDEIVSFLECRDKYKDYIKNTPECLIYNNYNVLSKKYLEELISERDIYESPNCCLEV